jgi:hypothetical protein
MAIRTLIAILITLIAVGFAPVAMAQNAAVAEAIVATSLEEVVTALEALRTAQKAAEDRLKECCPDGAAACEKKKPTAAQLERLEAARQAAFERRLAATAAWQSHLADLASLRQELGEKSEAWEAWKAAYGARLGRLEGSLDKLSRRVDELGRRVDELESRVATLEKSRLFLGGGFSGGVGGGWGGQDPLRAGLSTPIFGWGLLEAQWDARWRFRVTFGGGFNPLLGERSLAGGLAGGVRIAEKGPDLYWTGEVVRTTAPDRSGESVLAVGRWTGVRAGFELLWSLEAGRTRFQIGPFARGGAGWGEQYTPNALVRAKRDEMAAGVMITASLRPFGR